MSAPVYSSYVTQAWLPAGCPLRDRPDAVCVRVDGLTGEPEALAERILSPTEHRQWTSMHAVEKRRREWLLGRWVSKQAAQSLLGRDAAPPPALAKIEIVPDPYGRPTVSLPPQFRPPALSIAHSQGTAVALAVLDPDTLVGVDLESLSHRRQDYESVAFDPQERALLTALSPDLRQQWALRMWCAKEAVGKALGHGLSDGLMAFHVTRAVTHTGVVEVELRGAALVRLPQFAGRSFTVYTAMESDFVFSAMIYQQGAVRMRPSLQEILDYLLQKMGELTEDWDYTDPVGPHSLLFTELGFESLDAVVLCTAIQEHYQTPMPFAELLAEIGQQQRDLSIDELTDFVNTHLSPTGTHTTGRVQ